MNHGDHKVFTLRSQRNLRALCVSSFVRLCGSSLAHLKSCTKEKPGRSKRPALIVLPPVQYLTIPISQYPNIHLTIHTHLLNTGIHLFPGPFNFHSMKPPGNRTPGRIETELFQVRAFKKFPHCSCSREIDHYFLVSS